MAVTLPGVSNETNLTPLASGKSDNSDDNSVSSDALVEELELTVGIRFTPTAATWVIEAKFEFEFGSVFNILLFMLFSAASTAAMAEARTSTTGAPSAPISVSSSEYFD